MSRKATVDPANAKRATTTPSVAAQRIAETRAHTLEPEVKGEMENRLGHRFGDVRVHTEADAAELATGLGARAFTVGRDIAFAAGAYQPSAAEGRRLIAHELAHVVQQANVGDPARATQLGEPRYEGEAHRAASQLVARGAPAALSRIAGTAVVQRDDGASKDKDAQAAAGGITVTIVIRAPDDKFTQDVTDYARNTLNDKNLIEADNLDEAIAMLEKMTKGGGPKIKNLRIIGHGSTTGGIKMTPKGGTGRRVRHGAGTGEARAGQEPPEQGSWLDGQGRHRRVLGLLYRFDTADRRGIVDALQVRISQHGRVAAHRLQHLHPSSGQG